MVFPFIIGDYMNIKLYINNSEKNRLIKNITNEYSIDCIIKNPTNLYEPEIHVTSFNPTHYNYCYITEFKRYYFIDNITSLNNNSWLIKLSIDVLHTYSNEIIKCNGIITKNPDDNIDLYLHSDIWKTNVKTKTFIKQFPSGLSNDGEYILITAGG